MVESNVDTRRCEGGNQNAFLTGEYEPRIRTENLRIPILDLSLSAWPLLPWAFGLALATTPDRGGRTAPPSLLLKIIIKEALSPIIYYLILYLDW